MALKKKRIGELEGSPLVIGDNNLVNDFETLVEMNPDNTIKDIKRRKGDSFHTVINNETINSQIDLLNELTEDGDFGAEVLKAGASVTDDELISLFGDVEALNGQSRRNALLSQLLEAFSINDGVKELDFSKLYAIGNGQKVSTPIVPIEGGMGDGIIVWTAAQMPGFKKNESSLILVCFDEDNKRIGFVIKQIVNIDTFTGDIYDNDIDDLSNGYFYATIANNGEDVSNKAFGTFIIKTRAEE